MTYEEYQQQLAREQIQGASHSERDPHGFFGNVLDYLSRGQYFSAKFFDVLAKDGLGAFGDALNQGLAEMVSPQERLSFEDVLDNKYPDMNPVAKGILGLTGDLVLDPLNALSFGTLGAERVYGKALSKLGMATRTAIEMGDSLRAVAGDTEKLQRIAKMTGEAKTPAAKELLTYMFRENATKLAEPLREASKPASALRINEIMKHTGLEDQIRAIDNEMNIIQQQPPRGLFGSLDRLLGAPPDNSVGQGDLFKQVVNPERMKQLETSKAAMFQKIEELKQSGDPLGFIASNYGEEAAAKLRNTYRKPFEVNLNANSVERLSDNSNDLYWLADRIRSGEASLDETKFAWDFVKHASDDPKSAELLIQNAFPAQAEKAIKYEELKQEALRNASESADKKMAELMGMELTVDPATKKMKLAEGAKPTQNLQFIDKGGVKLLGKTVIPGEVFHTLSNVTGLNKLIDKAADTKLISSVVGAFNRNFKLPDWFIKLREDHDASQLSISSKLMNNLHDIFGGGLTKDQRKLISQSASEIQEATLAEATRQGDALAAMGGKGLNVKLRPEQVNMIRNQVLEKTGLINDKKAYAAYVKLRHANNEINMALTQAGLHEDIATNFHPLVHEVIDNPEKFKAFKAAGNPEGAYKTLGDMKADGLEPDMDALTLYATRFIDAKKKLAMANFKHAAANTLGLDSWKKLPERLQRDITLTGDSSYAGVGESVRGALQLYDKALGAFKTMATVAKPSFGIRQAVSNTLQSYLVHGVKGLWMADPRSAMDGLGVILAKHGLFKPEEWAKFRLETPFGVNYSGPQLSQIFEDLGVLKGSNISGSVYSKNSAKELASKFPGNDPSTSGLKKIASEVMRYTNWPSHIEDQARAFGVIQGLRMGYSPRHAARMANTMFFDYNNGLSRFGQVLAKRMVPFFSYTNFVLPLIGNIMMTHPNRIANVNKVAKGFLSVMNKWHGGETLTPSERAVLPGFLLEQPHYLEGFDENTKAVFHTFNNFSPLDIMGTGQLDEKGQVDLKSTIQKVALSQLTPLIKYPLELLAGKNYFTGLPINTATSGKIGNVNPDEFISNLTGLVLGANQGNIAVGLAGKVGSQLVAKGVEAVTPDAVQEGIKKLIGWEPVVDPRTNIPTVYINPYMFHAMSTIIPALGQVVRMQRADLKPQEKMADFLLGVGTQKQNLLLNLKYQNKDFANALRDQKSLVHKAILAGRPDLTEQEQENLRQLILSIMEWRNKIDSKDIRG